MIGQQLFTCTCICVSFINALMLLQEEEKRWKIPFKNHITQERIDLKHISGRVTKLGALKVQLLEHS